MNQSFMVGGILMLALWCGQINVCKHMVLYVCNPFTILGYFTKTTLLFHEIICWEMNKCMNLDIVLSNFWNIIHNNQCSMVEYWTLIAFRRVYVNPVMLMMYGTGQEDCKTKKAAFVSCLLERMMSFCRQIQEPFLGLMLQKSAFRSLVTRIADCAIFMLSAFSYCVNLVS